jgi:anti-sigma factor RsiW
MKQLSNSANDKSANDNVQGRSAIRALLTEHTVQNKTDLAEVAALSEAVQQALKDESAREIQEAREAFTLTHAHLMNRISEDTLSHEAPDALPAFSPVKPWPWEKSRLKQQRVSAIEKHLSRFRKPVLRWAVAGVLICGAGVSGHYMGQMNPTHELPVQSLINDFDSGLKSPTPLEFIAQKSDDAHAAAGWLSSHIGISVHVPSVSEAGAELIGARRSLLGSNPVSQTHYLKNGVRVALYQVREPRYSMGGFEEVQLDGRIFMTKKSGDYRVVAWRSGENVLTMVSPLELHESLTLAQAMRTSELEAQSSVRNS